MLRWRPFGLVIRVEDSVWVKRLQPILSKQIVRIHSDNPKYDPDDMPPGEIHIIGRVISIVARRL